MSEFGRRGVSLKPCDTEGDPVEASRVFNIALVERNSRPPSKEETERVFIRHCNAALGNSLELLSEEHRLPQVQFARLSHAYGAEHLWRLKGVYEFKRIRNHVLKYGDEDDRRWFRQGNFEELNRWTNGDKQLDLLEKSMKICAKFASILGLTHNQAHQLAMMLAFVQVRELPNRDRKAMHAVLTELGEWIQVRLEKAKEKQAAIENRAPEPRMDEEEFALDGLFESASLVVEPVDVDDD